MVNPRNKVQSYSALTQGITVTNGSFLLTNFQIVSILQFNYLTMEGTR